LVQAENRLYMADAGFTRADDQQGLYTTGLADLQKHIQYLISGMDTIFTFIIVNVLDQGLFEGIIFFNFLLFFLDLKRYSVLH